MREQRALWSEIPGNVRWFACLWLGFSVCGLGALVWHSMAIWSTLNAHQQSRQLGLLAGVPLVIAMEGGLLWWAAFYRINRARWLLLTLYALGVFDEFRRALFLYLVFHRPPSGMTWFNALSMVIGSASFLLLFGGNAREWFRPDAASRTDTVSES